jgi:hypothetical protein
MPRTFALLLDRSATNVFAAASMLRPASRYGCFTVTRSPSTTFSTSAIWRINSAQWPALSSSVAAARVAQSFRS